MDSESDGTGNRCREIDDCRKTIAEIDSFLIDNDQGIFEATRVKYYDNYISHLIDLYYADQLYIERDKNGNINGVCGWIVIDKKDEEDINKIAWKFPSTINAERNGFIPDRCVLHITFCIFNGGNINRVRNRLVELYRDKVDEVTWFNMPRNKYFRVKNILKGACHECC